MKALSYYAFLQGKISLRNFFKFMLTFLLIGGILACIVYITYHNLPEEERRFSTLDIGVVLADNDELTLNIVSLFESMGTVKDVCTFTIYEREEAFARLEAEDISCVLDVPSGFIAELVSINNISGDAYLLKPNLVSFYVDDLLNTVTNMLVSCQTGINYMSLYCYDNGLTEYVPGISDDLNKKFILKILTRKSIYQKEELESQVFNQLTFYIAVGYIVLLFFLCCACSLLVKRPTKGLQLQLRTFGIKFWHTSLIQCLLLFLQYAILTIALLLSAMILQKKIPNIPISITLNGVTLLSLLTVLLCVTFLVILVYTLSKSFVSGTLIIFITMFVMTFISGGIIPSIMLPNKLRALADFLPTTYLFNSIANLLSGSFDKKTFYVTAIFALIALIILIIYKPKEES